MYDALLLGASLYIPATRDDLCDIAAGRKLAFARSVIFCTEDAIAERDIPAALENLRAMLAALVPCREKLRFIRVRNPDILRAVLAMPGVERLSGFVLPKVTRHNFTGYMDELEHSPHVLMPTLETRESFDDAEMIALRGLFERPEVHKRILSLRIGGNDLLSLIGMRRPRLRTIYQTPIGVTISRLVTLFRPWGFNLSAPVFEYLEDSETLIREVDEDLAHGLIGKTAVHPDQIALIERRYCICENDREMAERILAPDSPAVFRMHDAMCEPATHRNWARQTIIKAKHYGQRDIPDMPVVHFPVMRG